MIHTQYVLKFIYKGNFGKNLKELRRGKGFSQEIFASKIGIQVTNLS